MRYTGQINFDNGEKREYMKCEFCNHEEIRHDRSVFFANTKCSKCQRTSKGEGSTITLVAKNT